MEQEEYKLVSAEEALKELDANSDYTEVAKRLADFYGIEYVNLYTREEVYQVAWYVFQKARTIIAKQRDWSLLFTEEQIKQIINSEIETVKLF